VESGRAPDSPPAGSRFKSVAVYANYQVTDTTSDLELLVSRSSDRFGQRLSAVITATRRWSAVIRKFTGSEHRARAVLTPESVGST
jgi:hypothetical protein